MFKEWLERMFDVFLVILIIIGGLLAFSALMFLWIMLFTFLKWLAIAILIIVLAVPLGTLIYTIYDNWFIISDYIEDIKEKWRGEK